MGKSQYKRILDLLEKYPDDWEEDWRTREKEELPKAEKEENKASIPEVNCPDCHAGLSANLHHAWCLKCGWQSADMRIGRRRESNGKIQ